MMRTHQVRFGEGPMEKDHTLTPRQWPTQLGPLRHPSSVIASDISTVVMFPAEKLLRAGFGHQYIAHISA